MSKELVKIDTDGQLPELPLVTGPQLDLYLAYLATTGRKRYSAIMAGVQPGRMVYQMKKNEDLKIRELGAMQEYAELIDAAVHDRAVNGVPRGVFYKGVRIAIERHYSDPLLMMLAKAHNEKYRDHLSVDANVTAGVLVVQASLDPDEWENQYGGMRIDTTRIDRDCAKPSKASK
jgi:hypothetical protein